MAKRFSRINFILVTILVALGLVLSFCSFKLPFYTNDYAGFVNAISMSYDLGDAQTAVFEVKPVSEEVESVTDEQLCNTLTFVRKVLASFGASNNQVGLQNSNEIRAMIPASDTSADLMEALANPLKVTIRGAETTEKTKYDISAERISSCKASYQNTSSTTNAYSFGVYMTFDSLGTKQYKELTKYVANNGNTLYFYDADGNKLGSLGEITREQFAGETFMPISSLTTENATNLYAANVLMGTIDTKLVVKENSVAAAYMGNNSALFVGIGLAVAFVLIMVLMIIRYRDLGLMFMLTSVINVILYLFLLQALPIVTLSIAGIAGCVLGFALTTLCHIIVFQNIKQEYQNGRRIPLSFKLGFKNSLFKIVDICSVSFLASLALYFAGFDIIKSFAVAFAIGSVLAIVSSLLITRLFTRWYLPLNSTKESHLGLKKETAADEE